MVDYFVGRGGQLRTKSRLQRVLLGSGGDVEGFQLADGSTVTGDLYVSAMPGMRPLHPAQIWYVSPSCAVRECPSRRLYGEACTEACPEAAPQAHKPCACHEACSADP